MTLKEFRRRLAATGIQAGSATGRACKRVMVDSESAYSAAVECGVDQAAISRAARKLREADPADDCPHCGQRIR